MTGREKDGVRGAGASLSRQWRSPWRQARTHLATPGPVRAVALIAAVAALAFGAAQAAALVVDHVLITHDLYGEPLGSPAAAEGRFPGQVATCLLLLAAGTVLARATRDRPATVAGAVLLVVGVGAVLVAAASLGIGSDLDWPIQLPDPSVEPSTDQPTCRSGAEACPGG